MNATLTELQRAKKIVREGEEPCFVISVEEHKTGVEGQAKLFLSPLDYARQQEYLLNLRPLRDPHGESPFLIIFSGGRQLVRMSQIQATLGQRYNIVLPTATKVRKIGATLVALHVGVGGTATLVKRQLSHTAVTDEKYYQAIVGDTHSAQAFNTMEALRKSMVEGKPKSSGKDFREDSGKDSRESRKNSTKNSRKKSSKE